MPIISIISSFCLQGFTKKNPSFIIDVFKRKNKAKITYKQKQDICNSRIQDKDKNFLYDVISSSYYFHIFNKTC